MKWLHGVALLGAVCLTSCSDDRSIPLSPDRPSTVVAVSGHSAIAVVSSAADAGDGSFREAILSATIDPSIRQIRFDAGVGTIALQQSIIFAGSQSLTIDGAVILDGALLPAGASAFVSTGGGDLAIHGMTVRSAPAAGILVDVPDDAIGTIRYAFVDVTAAANGSHGILINDQKEYLDDPNSTSQEGSSASIDVTVRQSTSRDNGFTALDQDGIRINEGGAGTLTIHMSQTSVFGNGGDGVELDERGTGDVHVLVQNSTFNSNGSFDASDYDDGIDIDESGDGSVTGAFLHTAAIDNYEQGFDLNENDAGDLRVDMTDVEASGNAEEGIEYEEDDDNAGGGDIVATLTRVTVIGNGSADGDAGLKLREKGDGSLDARLARIDARDNAITGVLVREDASGDLAATIVSSRATNNARDGFEYDENNDGALEVRVLHATISNNSDAGTRAEQGGAGSGLLELVSVALVGNSLDLDVDAGVTVIRR